MKTIEEFIGKMIQGDCLEVLRDIPDNSVDACVTDPPAGISFMGKEWDTFDHDMFGKKGEEGENDLKVKKNFNILPRYNNADLIGFQNFICQAFTEVIRILKPGGHALVWAIPKTSHHTAMGLERAGFEIREKIFHIFGSGFPKSLNISKAIEKKNSPDKWKNNRYGGGNAKCSKCGKWIISGNPCKCPKDKIEFESVEAKQWDGWGTTLKPAVEEWILIRKPLSEDTIVENVLKWRVGGLNIDGCRIKVDPEIDKSQLKTMNRSAKAQDERKGWGMNAHTSDTPQVVSSKGRFPANIILDEESGKMLDKQTGLLKSGDNCIRRQEGHFLKHGGLGKDGDVQTTYGDVGGASRFFYCAKASRKEKGENNEHPTIKPIALMEYLVKLITKEGQIILDPFMGSGSTIIACIKQNRNYIGIEKETEYCEIAKKRIEEETRQGKLL